MSFGCSGWAPSSKASPESKYLDVWAYVFTWINIVVGLSGAAPVVEAALHQVDEVAGLSLRGTNEWIDWWTNKSIQ